MPNIPDNWPWILGVLLVLYVIEEHWLRRDSWGASKKELGLYVAVGLMFLFVLSVLNNWRSLLFTVEIIVCVIMLILIAGLSWFFIRYGWKPNKGGVKQLEDDFARLTKFLKGVIALYYERKAERTRRLEAELQKPSEIEFKQRFETRTPANFIAHYELTLKVDGTKEALAKTNVWDSNIQQKLANEYEQNVFNAFLQEHSYRFVFQFNKPNTLAASREAVSSSPGAFRSNNGEEWYRRVDVREWVDLLSERRLTTDGLKISVTGIVDSIFPNDAVERNYTMITTPQKNELATDKRYRAYDEVLAVAALKRRLDFVRCNYRQVHEGDWVAIETERSGRGLRIVWIFKPNAPGGYDLLGFRKLDGFCPNQWDEQQNGTLVVQSSKSGETTEFLKEGQTYFYTFILRPWKADESTLRYAIARFQITIVPQDETDLIDQTIRRIEDKGQAVETNQQLTRAIAALGSFTEFEVMFDSTVKNFVTQIQNATFSDEEKKAKIERLLDFARILKEDYQ